MASSANPGLWSDLSDLSGTDACAALLKVNAEMFVAAPARDRESIETFEALAMGFLPKADRATLADIARILAPCPDTPPSVLDYLQRHTSESHGSVQHDRIDAAPAPDRRRLATTAGRVQLASDRQIGEAMIELILVLREEASENALAANPALSSSWGAFHRLVRRAIDRPDLARILLERTDLARMHEACLYLAADRKRRALIREHLARSLAQGASTTLRLPEQGIAALTLAAADNDIAHFERTLSDAFGFPGTTEWHILQIGRHPLLALALKALGLERKEAACIFLTLHPALSYRLSALRELMHEMRDVPQAVALAIIEAVLGTKALAGSSRV